MLSEDEKQYVNENAYIPEHLPDYFVPFSGMEPFLEGTYLYYRSEDVISFIGYPLDAVVPAAENHAPDSGLDSVLEAVIAGGRPKTLSIVAPRMPAIDEYEPDAETGEQDAYSLLDLQTVNPASKARNMVRRAARELSVVEGKAFTAEHRDVLEGFLRRKQFPDMVADFYRRLPNYLAHSPGARTLEARHRKSGQLAGFVVAELGGGDFSFYLFNITRDDGKSVPGTSDLLVGEMTDLAGHAGKRYINMGLGVNEGVRWFKRKWGAADFLNYAFLSYQRVFSWRSLLRIFKRS